MPFSLPATVTQESANQLRMQGLEDLTDLATINCSELKEFDSSVLAVLLAWRKSLQENQQPFLIERAPEKLKVLAKVYGVSTLLGL